MGPSSGVGSRFPVPSRAPVCAGAGAGAGAGALAGSGNRWRELGSGAVPGTGSGSSVPGSGRVPLGSGFPVPGSGRGSGHRFRLGRGFREKQQTIPPSKDRAVGDQCTYSIQQGRLAAADCLAQLIARAGANSEQFDDPVGQRLARPSRRRVAGKRPVGGALGRRGARMAASRCGCFLVVQPVAVAEHGLHGREIEVIAGRLGEVGRRATRARRRRRSCRAPRRPGRAG